MPDTEPSIAIRYASATGRQVITAAMGGAYVSAGLLVGLFFSKKS